jgi:hypothetical protein
MDHNQKLENFKKDVEGQLSSLNHELQSAGATVLAINMVYALSKHLDTVGVNTAHMKLRDGVAKLERTCNEFDLWLYTEFVQWPNHNGLEKEVKLLKNRMKRNVRAAKILLCNVEDVIDEVFLEWEFRKLS